MKKKKRKKSEKVKVKNKSENEKERKRKRKVKMKMKMKLKLKLKLKLKKKKSKKVTSKVSSMKKEIKEESLHLNSATQDLLFNQLLIQFLPFFSFFFSPNF